MVLASPIPIRAKPLAKPIADGTSPVPTPTAPRTLPRARFFGVLYLGLAMVLASPIPIRAKPLAKADGTSYPFWAFSAC